MLRLESILCPVDFSDESALALGWAVALAAGAGSRLTVLTAVDPLLAEAAKVRLGVDLVKSDAEPALRDFAKEALREDLPLSARVRLEARIGEPWEVILAAARRHGADLIAMGTHGLGGFRKLLLGSTAERVLRETTRPVLAVPAGAPTPAPPDKSPTGLDIKRIVVGTDFSEASTTALQWAIDLAQLAGAALVVCHVVPASGMPAEWRARVAEIDEERVQNARVRLEAVAAHVGDTVPYETVLPLGRPADALASIAEERDADLIVLGLFSEPDEEAQRPGSIAYRVVSTARRPVLVVPPTPPA